MAPGLYVVWSHGDPAAVTEIKPDGTFKDAVTELPGVAVGAQIERMDMQVMPYPYSHDIPFMTLYDMPEVEYHKDEAFKEVEKACLSRAENACKPRVYEEILRGEVEGCENLRPRVKDSIGIVTSRPPRPDQVDDFWKWQNEEYIPSLMEGPTFLRVRVFKAIGEPDKEGEVPSSPYMWVLEWEDDGLPWLDLTSVAQSKEWMRLVENGLIWQGLCYQVKRYSVKFEGQASPAAKSEKDGSESDDYDV